MDLSQSLVQPGMVKRAYNYSTGETEGEGALQIQSQPKLHCKTLSQKTKGKKQGGGCCRLAQLSKVTA